MKQLSLHEQNIEINHHPVGIHNFTLSRHFENFHKNDNGGFSHTYTRTSGKSKLQKLDPSYLN